MLRFGYEKGDQVTTTYFFCFPLPFPLPFSLPFSLPFPLPFAILFTSFQGNYLSVILMIVIISGQKNIACTFYLYLNFQFLAGIKTFKIERINYDSKQ